MGERKFFLREILIPVSVKALLAGQYITYILLRP
jgi:hypothetical protein